MKKRSEKPHKHKRINNIETLPNTEDEFRLNKFIAHAGVCARREADLLIAAGKVSVNGKPVTEMGVKVKSTDKVKVEGKVIGLEPFVYILMNKPKNTITTTSDEKGRNTVLDLIEEDTGHRVYPVGRLDRNTTGALLLTNDGDLANRLMHPSYKVRKIYKVTTAEPLTDEQLINLETGVQLEDGLAMAKQVKRSTVDPNSFSLTLFEGRNRQVRRMVETLGGVVEKLDRTTYAGLNTKGLRMGRWKNLNNREISELRVLVKLDEPKSIKRKRK
ncbi:MAG: pseudouridine synthase [Balneolales bacterium]